MFSWLHTWKLGAKSLVLHPLRSSLTVLGIFFGVASVIWLLAIGEGISAKAQEQIEGLGASNIIVRSIKPADMGETTGGARTVQPYGLTRRDFERLTGKASVNEPGTRTISTIDQAIPIREIRKQFMYKDRLVDGRLVGCTPDYAEVTQLVVDRGHFLSDAELRQKKNVCVLAAEVAERLFPIEDPIRRSVRIEDAYYVVVGVMKPRQSTAAIGGSLAAQEFNNDIYIPITTLWTRIGDFIRTSRSGSFEFEVVELSQITLRVDKTENVLETSEIVKDVIGRHHRLDDYAMTVPLELLEQAKITRLMFNVFMGLIAAISLVVGGIGIMNIMLATVTERTREIGIRRALGAKRGDITMQFLTETILLSVVGGLIGIGAGLLCGPAIDGARDLLKQAMPERFANLPDVIQTMTPIVVPWSYPLAFGISVVVGVVFGLYPAIRAAAMHPVEALRHE